MGRPSKNTIETATQRYLVDRSDDHRDRLVEVLMPWIRMLARRVKGQMATKLEADDLEQVGAIGLVKSLPRYDGRCSVTTFALLRVKGAMIDECRQASVVPRLVQQRVAKILSAEKRLGQELGRRPTEAEIESACGLTREEFVEALRFRRAAHEVAIIPTFRTDENSDVEVPSEGDDKSPAPTISQNRLALLRRTLKGLSKRERLLILGYYFEENTMKEVGEHLDLSESRVSQMHSELVERLRDRHRPHAPELFELARAS